MGWMELLMVGVVALIVVGPKDLPAMFQSLGRMTAKVRRMAREFSQAMNEAADATGAGDVAKDLRGLTSSKNLGLDALKDAADKFDKWEPGKEPKVMGSETAKLAADRAEAARKIREATEKREAAKRATEVGESPVESAPESLPDSPVDRDASAEVAEAKTDPKPEPSKDATT